MPATRTFNVVRVSTDHGSGLPVTAAPDAVVTYDGTTQVVSLSAG